MSTPKTKASTSASTLHPAVAEDQRRRSQNPPVTDFWKHVRRIVEACGEHEWSNVLALANNEARGKMTMNNIKSRLIQHQVNLASPLLSLFYPRAGTDRPSDLRWARSFYFLLLTTPFLLVPE